MTIRAAFVIGLVIGAALAVAGLAMNPEHVAHAARPRDVDAIIEQQRGYSAIQEAAATGGAALCAALPLALAAVTGFAARRSHLVTLLLGVVWGFLLVTVPVFAVANLWGGYFSG